MYFSQIHALQFFLRLSCMFHFFFNLVTFDEKKVMMKSNFSGPLVWQLLFIFHLKYTYLSLDPNTKMFLYNFLVSFNDFSLIFL